MKKNTIKVMVFIMLTIMALAIEETVKEIEIFSQLLYIMQFIINHLLEVLLCVYGIIMYLDIQKNKQIQKNDITIVENKINLFAKYFYHKDKLEKKHLENIFIEYDIYNKNLLNAINGIFKESNIVIKGQRQTDSRIQYPLSNEMFLELEKEFFKQFKLENK